MEITKKILCNMMSEERRVSNGSELEGYEMVERVRSVRSSFLFTKLTITVDDVDQLSVCEWKCEGSY